MKMPRRDTPQRRIDGFIVSAIVRLQTSLETQQSEKLTSLLEQTHVSM